MFKEYLVYQNKVYSNFVNYINDYILLSKDPAMLKEGFVPYSSYVDDAGEGVAPSHFLVLSSYSSN